MTVKRKAQKNSQHQIEEVINRGGKVSADGIDPVSTDEIRFTLRIPRKIIKKIDKERENLIGKISRNQWILQAIEDKLDTY